MSTYVSREDVRRYVAESLADSTMSTTLTQSLEAWPDLTGYHDLSGADGPDRVGAWIERHIERADSALERYRCIRGTDVYWGIVVEHQVSAFHGGTPEVGPMRVEHPVEDIALPNGFVLSALIRRSASALISANHSAVSAILSASS
jgi:hypothetical protein